MKLKLNIDILGYRKGQVIDVESVKGKPRDRFWRDRLKDSAIDNCVEVVVESKKVKTTKKKDK